MTTESSEPPSDELPKGVMSRTVNGRGVIEYWDAKGEHHNPDGPAIIHPDKATYWLVTGRDPKEQGCEWFNYEMWCQHGNIHRTDGPAVLRGDGTCAYYVDGIQFSETWFHKQYPAQQSPLAPPRRNSSRTGERLMRVLRFRR